MVLKRRLKQQKSRLLTRKYFSMILLQGWKRACKVLVINGFKEKIKATEIKIINQEILQHDPVTRVEKGM